MVQSGNTLAQPTMINAININNGPNVVPANVLISQPSNNLTTASGISLAGQPQKNFQISNSTGAGLTMVATSIPGIQTSNSGSTQQQFQLQGNTMMITQNSNNQPTLQNSQLLQSSLQSQGIRHQLHQQLQQKQHIQLQQSIQQTPNTTGNQNTPTQLRHLLQQQQMRTLNPQQRMNIQQANIVGSIQQPQIIIQQNQQPLRFSQTNQVQTQIQQPTGNGQQQRFFDY